MPLPFAVTFSKLPTRCNRFFSPQRTRTDVSLLVWKCFPTKVYRETCSTCSEVQCLRRRKRQTLREIRELLVRRERFVQASLACRGFDGPRTRSCLIKSQWACKRQDHSFRNNKKWRSLRFSTRRSQGDIYDEAIGNALLAKF